MSKKKPASKAKSVDEQMADAVESMPQSEANEILDPGAQYKPAPAVEAAPAVKGEKMVKIKIPVSLKIKRVVYNPGVHTVPEHLAETMIEMVHRKRRADLSIFVGKNHLIERLLDRTLVVHEVEQLDMNKIVRK